MGIKSQDNWETLCKREPREVALFTGSPCSSCQSANQGAQLQPQQDPTEEEESWLSEQSLSGLDAKYTF